MWPSWKWCSFGSHTAPNLGASGYCPSFIANGSVVQLAPQKALMMSLYQTLVSAGRRLNLVPDTPDSVRSRPMGTGTPRFQTHKVCASTQHQGIWEVSQRDT